jgi:hypothetical protein
MEIKFYKDWKDDFYFAVPDMGFKGIFKLNLYKPGNKEWQYLPPQSDGWDSAHQYIFRQHDGIEIDPFELDFKLPDLPPIPEPPPEGWKEHFREKAHARVNDYPHLFSALSDNSKRRLIVYVILYEDQYETSSGDGKFLYFAGAFTNRDTFLSRKNELDASAGHWYVYHAREFTLEWDEDFYFSNDFEVRTFEHFTFEDTLTSLERKIEEIQE